MSATMSVASRTRATSSSRIPIAAQGTVGRGRRATVTPTRRQTPRGQVVGPPAEELDAEAEREPVGHAARRSGRPRAAAASRPRDRHRTRVAAASGSRCGASAKYSTRPGAAGSTSSACATRRRTHVDPLVVERRGTRRAPRPPARSSRPRRCGRSRRAPRDERADLLGARGRRRRRAPPAGSSSGSTIPARTASSKSWQT